jgi:hypothetical protein
MYTQFRANFLAYTEASRLAKKAGNLMAKALAWRPSATKLLAPYMRFSARVLSQPWFFPVALAIAMGLLWAHMHGMHPPLSMCEWRAYLSGQPAQCSFKCH